MDLAAIVERLRIEGGDSVAVEAKAAGGGLPTSITSTICALANLPGGGIIILGLDERTNFMPVQLQNIQSLKQGLSSKARACVPPVQLVFEDQSETIVDGHEVVVATVKECDPASKPVRVAASGLSYIRAWDGDFEMSELEVRGFQSIRNHPNCDRQPVEGATTGDLDPALIAIWEQTVKEFDPQGLGRFSGNELLLRAGITCDSSGTPSVAGLLALGIHPQQYFPRFVINLSQQPAPGSVDSRATNLTTLTGPVPLMLDGALDWARKTFSRSVVTKSDGEVVDQYQYPLDAFRELIGNALAHRDLAPWSQGDATEVRLLPDRLIVTNPGGLYGISVDRLGRPGTTSARNGRLVEILKYARTSGGARVVETLASGIPRVLDAAKAAGMPMPIFQNTDIRFTVLWHAPSVVASPHSVVDTVFLKGSAAEVASQLTSEGQTASDIALALGLTIPNVRKILRGLIESQVAVRDGGQGKITVYRKNASSPPIIAEKPPLKG